MPLNDNDEGCKYSLQSLAALWEVKREKPSGYWERWDASHAVSHGSWCNEERLSLPRLNICSARCLCHPSGTLLEVLWSESMPKGLQWHLPSIGPSHSTSQGDVSYHNWILLIANCVWHLWSVAMRSILWLYTATLWTAYKSEFSEKVECFFKINKIL